jgi:hypothetical protein
MRHGLNGLGIILMEARKLTKKETLPDPRCFDPKRDGFWKLKYPSDPNYDY